jgi:hypothetical protein
MKKLILLLFVFAAFTVNAQKGYIKTVATDTLKGDNNVEFADIVVSGTYNSLVIEATCTKISSAAGGTLYLQGGISTYQTLNSDNSYVKFSTNDTLTVTDGVVWRIEIPDPPERKYRLYGDGDASDTVKVSTIYYLK